MKKIPTHKLQAILDGGSPWPYLGNAYRNANGSLSIVLDRGVKIILADGTLVEPGDDGKPVKLYLKPAVTRAPSGVETPA